MCLRVMSERFARVLVVESVGNLESLLVRFRKTRKSQQISSNCVCVRAMFQTSASRVMCMVLLTRRVVTHTHTNSFAAKSRKIFERWSRKNRHKQTNNKHITSQGHPHPNSPR